jgi:broad specificity phosphatase PhoE
MIIYLLRHGQQVNHNSYSSTAGLTPLGIRQANLVGWRLQNGGIFRIYSSDMPRAVQTAETINRHLHREVIIVPEFREISFGEWEGLSYEEVDNRYRHFKWEFDKHLQDMPYPGGESGEDVRKRAFTALDSISSGGMDVAIVTHGGVIMTILTAIMGLGLEKRFRLHAPEHCSISKISYEPGKGYGIICINDTAHLVNKL